MRAVCLSNKKIQQQIKTHFIPLKVVIKARSEKFPIEWPAMEGWRLSWKLMKGDGFTGCSVVSPDLQTEYGSTGSAMVWELFDSIAYDAGKFSAMLDRAQKRAVKEKEIRNDASLGKIERGLALRKFRNETKRAVKDEGRFRLPPKGFSIEKAKDIFRATGDLKD